MTKFIDAHGHIIRDGERVFFEGNFPKQVPTEKRIRDGIAIVDGEKLVFAVNINNQLQGIGLYWEFDDEPCYDLAVFKLNDEHHENMRDGKSDYQKLILDLRYEGLTYEAEINEDGNIAVIYNDGHTVSIFAPDCSHIETINLDDEEEEWTATEKAILALNEKYPKAIAIFGGARLVKSVEDIVRMLPSVIHSAKFFGWHDTLAGACRTFCSLCFTDYMLVEAFIGIRFEELCKGEN